MAPENLGEKITLAGGAALAGIAVFGAVVGSAESASAHYVDSRGKVVVSQGDTLSGIIHDETGHTGAQLYDHDVPAVAHANHLTNANQIHPGQKLDLSTVEPRPASVHPNLANWQIRNSQDTWWEISEVVAAINGTSRERAFHQIIESNPDTNPETQQVGDEVHLPIEQAKFHRIMDAVDHIARGRSRQAQSARPVLAPIAPQPEAVTSNSSQSLAREVLADPNISIAPSTHDRVRLSIVNIEDDGQTFTHDLGYPGEVPVSPKLLEVLELLAKDHHITITSLTTGEHAPTSNHYRGRAVDLAVDMDVYRQLYENREAYGIDELIFASPPRGTMNLKHGLPLAYDQTTLEEHSSHIHFSVAAEPQPGAPKPPTSQMHSQLERAPYTTNSNVLSSSGLTADELNRILAGTPMEGLGQAFLDVEVSEGENALFVAEHAAIESAHGSSKIARTKHNLFGLNAYDSCPQTCADGYPDFAPSIHAYAEFLLENYLKPTGRYYAGGSTIADVFEHYSTAGQTEARSIVGMMNDDLRKIGK